jgi:hypothetical protein
MAEWWSTWASYRPGDFLMFAPRTYWRLFELVNLAWWPAPLALWAAGAAALWASARSRAPAAPAWAGRAALGVLALAWACSGHLFLWTRFAPIHWVAGWWAGLFGAAALLLLVLALARGAMVVAATGLQRRMAWALGAAALLMPLLAPAAGRPWAQAEVFGLAPDPTALLTLALLLVWHAPAGWARWAMSGVWTLAILWCLQSAATLATMGAPEAAVLGLGALLALAARWAGLGRGGR